MTKFHYQKTNGVKMPYLLSSNHSYLIIILLTVVFIYSCENKNEVKKSSSIKVDFNIESKAQGILVAYTNDKDSLWSKAEWLAEIKKIMKSASEFYNTVLLFDSKLHTPNVADEGINYSLDYDKWMVCGYWKFPKGIKKFCYGGQKEDGNFKHCIEE